MSRKLIFRLILIVALVIVVIRIFNDRTRDRLVHLTGQTMGTITYNVKYLTRESFDYQKEVDSLLRVFNQALSTYIPTSEISEFNKGDTIKFRSPLFYQVLAESEGIYKRTRGAFDPTIGPIVNAWGFGPDKQPKFPDSLDIDSILQYVGFDRIIFDSSGATKPTGMYLDLSAIAKGHAVDLVGEFLERKRISDYMIEIGGEVRCRGVNDAGQVWTIGIEDPVVARDERKLFATVKLKNKSLATSGNYRNYYTKDGQLYAHIVDPRSGYTAGHNLLSASVLAEDCMTADAYATAFMVLGLEKSQQLVAATDLEAILIYRTEAGTIATYVSDGLKSHVRLLNEEERGQ